MAEAMFNENWKGTPPKIYYLRRPFILRPERVGMESWIEVLRKLGISRGSPSWVDQFIPQMTETGRRVGISFNFNTKVGNSMSSLQAMHHFLLLERSGEIPRGTQEELALNLGTGHFEKQKCVADPDVLKAAVTKVLSDAKCPHLVENALEAISTNKHYEDVVEAIQREQLRGHHSIPFVDINGIELSGARSVSEYYEALWEAASKMK
eukprot:TRINITY_DN12698_c0_g1_i1.p1 TRINITY_DN12698_c0_g1~~TRINITY_DN12698_c0_g1_i1.p1  ORF type:complete len:208 (+),score=44.93 TRINITY_DN12698_c0_g1_i1:132-755(+)